MLTQDQIAGWVEGNEAMDRVEERLEAGVPVHRELSAQENRPFIRAALLWRRAAINLWAEKLAADQDAMGLGPVPEKYATKE